MAEVESHSNGNGKHALDDDGVDAPVKAKLLKTENGNGVAKAANGNGVKEDETAAAAEAVPVVDEEKSVGASNGDSNGVSDVAAGDQSNNKSDFNESESGAVSTGGVGDESNTNDLGVTNSSTNDLRNENTNESVGDAVLVSGGRRRVKEIGENSADNYEDDEDDEDDDDVGPEGEDDEEGGEDEDDDEVDEEDDEEGGEGEDDEDDGEDGGEE